MKNIEEEWYVLYIYTVGVQAEKRQGFHLFCLFLAHTRYHLTSPDARSH